MAFTFTVEDGTGLENATSYTSVTQSDDIITRNIHETTWPSLSTEIKEKLLSQATHLLDNYARWHGRRTSIDSALKWPRSGVCDADGYNIQSDQISSDLVEGTVELARWLAREDRTAERDQDALKSLKADVVELEFAEGKRPVIPSHVWSVLGALCGNYHKSKRIVR